MSKGFCRGGRIYSAADVLSVSTRDLFSASLDTSLHAMMACTNVELLDVVVSIYLCVLLSFFCRGKPQPPMLGATSITKIVGVEKRRNIRNTVAPRQLRPFGVDGWITWGRDSLRQQTVTGREAPFLDEHIYRW